MTEEFKNNSQESPSAKFAQFARFAQVASLPKDEELLNSKIIPSEVYENLPNFLKRGCTVFEQQREKDVFLTGAIGILSGCFNTVKGLYASEEHFPNLNCFIISPPGGGKGSMKHSRTLGSAIHAEKLNGYKETVTQYLASKSENPNLQEPNQPLFYIPANTTSPAVIRHMSENNESGIICETEADTMSEMFKMDFGGYSDLIRKAFHHETISSSRKGNREYYELKRPKLSVVLSGTPDQVKTLIQSSENGLFSRMIFYVFDGTDTWKSVAPKADGLNLNRYFDTLSNEVKTIHDKFSKEEFEFKLTESQWETLDNQFTKWLDEITTFVHRDTASIIKRLGLVQYRIAMLLSILRYNEEIKEGTTIYCSDQDFKTAQLLSETYLSHSLIMFFKLPRESKLALDKKIKLFFDALPSTTIFTREEALVVGRTLNIAERTIDKYLKRLVDIKFLEQPEYGKYKKS